MEHIKTELIILIIPYFNNIFFYIKITQVNAMFAKIPSNR